MVQECAPLKSAARSIEIRDPARDPTRALAAEWLLTNGLGGYAMGTALGANTRRYHGLLVVAATPPVTRVVALHSMAEQLVLDGEVLDLSTQQFGVDASLHPDGWRSLVRFDVEPPGRCVWEHHVRGLRIVRTLELRRDAHFASLSYRISGAPRGVVFRARPFMPLRDFHAIDRETTPPPMRARGDDAGVCVSREAFSLNARSRAAVWRDEPQWWRDFAYVEERARGQDWIEDLWSPGVFEITRDGGAEVTGRIDFDVPEAPVPAEPSAALSVTRNDWSARLRVAADQFVVRRHGIDGWDTSIIAGYPWFADWGRDAMIALPGALLEPGRHAEARSLLRLFLNHRKGGLLPNRFPDSGGEVEYNAADAGPWFIQAVYAYARASGDRDLDELLAAALDVVASYRSGTAFGVAVDADGLVRAGDGSVPVTWMDARRNGVSFTPRNGKPVELSALWHSGLRLLAELLEESGDARQAADLRDEAEVTARSMRSLFWWPERRCLYDGLVDDRGAWRPDASLRPNQVFAVSLPHSPLTADQQRGVLSALRDRLLTPYGLRTLEPGAPGYLGRYEGDLFRRDAAYHNGTVWPWLIGPYCDAVLRVEGDGDDTIRSIATQLGPLLASLDEGCLHQVAEVYDGDPPHRASGCPAQAWSVAELLRVWAKIGAPAGAP